MNLNEVSIFEFKKHDRYEVIFKFKIQIMIDACFEFKWVVLITFKFKTTVEL